MTAAQQLRTFLRTYLHDRSTSWSIGGYGAIAEFHWLPDDEPHGESADDACGHFLQTVSAAGALRITVRDDVIPHAYQSLSRHPERWLQGIALCLPWRRASCGGRRVLTEIGRDRHAIRDQDNQAVLFDLGLGLPHVDACVRSATPSLLKHLRAACGRSVLEGGNEVMTVLKQASPHRVFLSRLGRVEVYQRIAQPGQRPPTPLGPHTHVLPRLLASARPSAEQNDAPAYHRACAYLYPAHPLMDNLGERKTYDRDAHAKFSALMQRWGDPVWNAERERAMQAMRAGVGPDRYRAPDNAKGRRALRIAIRELAQQMGASDVIEDWRRRFDRPRGRSDRHLVH